jgi:aryl-alcohol dehydrogenase
MSIKVNAAVAYTDEELFRNEILTIEAPRANEILVKISGVGLCHTDLIAKNAAVGYPLPAVLGHEGSGIVEKVGADVTKVKAGDRVVMTFRSCETCDRCTDHHPAYCRTLPNLNFLGNREDGSSSLFSSKGPVTSNFFGQSSFASYAMGYESNIVKVSDDVPLNLIGPLGCGIQTGVGAVLRSLAVTEGSTILICGAGTVGLSAVMGARIQNCSTIIVIDPMASRRDLAKSLGATYCIDPEQEANPAQVVRTILPQGVDYAIDATGIAAVQATALSSLGSKGVLGLVGVSPQGTSLPGDVGMMINSGLTVKGIMEGDSDPDVFIPELIEHYKAGNLPIEKLIKTYKLSEINQAVADQHAGLCVKAVLIPDSFKG